MSGSDDTEVPPSATAPSPAGDTRPLPLPWAGLLALAAAAFIDVVTDLAPAGMLPGMSASLGAPRGDIGLLVSGYAAASALGAIPLTALTRGLPRRPVLCSVLTGFAILNAITAVSPGYLLALACRLLAGVLGGVLWAMLAPAAARLAPAGRRGRAVAIVLAGITVALALGIPAAAALAAQLGWRTVFGLLAVLAAIDAAWVRAAVPRRPGEIAARRPPLARVTARPGVRSMLTVTLLLLSGHQALYTYLALFARRSGIPEAAIVLFVFGLFTLGGVTAAGILADRHLRPALLGALSLLAAVFLTLGCAAGLAVATYVAVACWGLAFGAAPALIQIALINAAGPAGSDVATALQTTVYNIGIATGSLAGGLALDYSGAGTLPWVALPLVVSALLVAFGARRGLSRSASGAATVPSRTRTGPCRRRSPGCSSRS
jgi:predicted MFS family arabinose efflux permease